MGHASAKSRTAAPQKTPRAATETEAASACDVRPRKRQERRFRRLPEWLRPPARSAAPRPRHRRTETEARVGTNNPARASPGGRSRPRPGRASSPHERPRLGCAGERRRARAQPAAEPEAQSTFASGEAWQRHNHRGGCDPGAGYDRERRARSDPGSWEGHGDGGERRERCAIDQTEHDKREADRPQTGGTTLGSGARPRSASHRRSGREGRHRSAPRRRSQQQAQAERAAHDS